MEDFTMINTYLIPTRDALGCDFAYFTCVYADTIQNAFLQVNKEPFYNLNGYRYYSNDFTTYDVFYNGKLDIKSYSPLPIQDKDAIIEQAFKNKNSKEDGKINMLSLFKVNWNEYVNLFSLL